MEGPDLAISLVNNHLKWDLPLRFPTIIEQHNLDESYLLQPAEYYAYEPALLENWPTFVTNVMRTSKVASYGEFSDDYAQHLFDVTYMMRTYGWVRYDTVEDAVRMRYFTAMAVREALIDRPYLHPSPPDEAPYAKLDVFSIREEFSDPVHDDTINEHYIAAFFLEYNVTLTETLYRMPLGILTEPQVDVIPLPYPI